MELIKYVTNSLFDNSAFAGLLNENGVKAVAVDNGVILDRAAFNAIPLADMPLWMYNNRKYINHDTVIIKAM